MQLMHATTAFRRVQRTPRLPQRQQSRFIFFLLSLPDQLGQQRIFAGLLMFMNQLQYRFANYPVHIMHKVIRHQHHSFIINKQAGKKLPHAYSIEYDAAAEKNRSGKPAFHKLPLLFHDKGESNG